MVNPGNGTVQTMKWLLMQLWHLPGCLRQLLQRPRDGDIGPQMVPALTHCSHPPQLFPLSQDAVGCGWVLKGGLALCSLLRRQLPVLISKTHCLSPTPTTEPTSAVPGLCCGTSDPCAFNKGMSGEDCCVLVLQSQGFFFYLFLYV